MSVARTLSVLVAEDDEIDVTLLQRAFKHAEITNPLHVVRDGHEAIEFLSRLRGLPDERLPGLVLLDLKMPRRDGLQVLRWIREQPILRALPVAIFSSSANTADIENAYEAGANAYLIKPPSTAERNEVARFIKEWLRLVQAPVGATENIGAAQAERAAPPRK
jgi:CheY-like chemotaxis protein